MGSNGTYFRKNDYIIVIGLLSLLTYLTLYVSRSLDDNKLTNWQWIFGTADAAGIFFLLIIAVLISSIICRISISDKVSGLFLFLVSFITATFFWQTPETIVDTSRYFTQAKHLELYGMEYFVQEWGGKIDAWTDMPAVPFIYGLIFKFFGESRIYVQIFTTLCFSLTVVLTYLIGRELWDEDVGFYGGLGLLGMPYLPTQVPLMLVDVPTMFFITLSVFSFIKAINRGGIFLIISSAAIISLTFFAKYSTWLMLSVLFFVFVVFILEYYFREPVQSAPGLKADWRKDARPGNYIYRSISVFALAAIFIGMIIVYKYGVIVEQIDLLFAYQKPGLKRWGESFMSTFLFQIHPFLTAAALYSIYGALKKRDFRYLVIFWLVFLVVILQIRRIRYIIMIFPMLSLMASYGLRDISKREIKKFFISCIVTSSVVIAVFAYRPFLMNINTVNLSRAGDYLNSIEESYIEVFTLSPADPAGSLAVAVPILDLFAQKNIVYRQKRDESYRHSDRMKTSSLRFTWEYDQPDYYHREVPDENSAVVVIMGDAYTELSENIESRIEGYKRDKVFDTDEGVFRFRTFVVIYRKDIRA
jgi:hypothetical protein